MAMPAEERIREQIRRLIEHGEKLQQPKDEYDHVVDERQLSGCIAWITAAAHVVSLVCPNLHDPYRVGAAKIMEDANASGWLVRRYVGHLVALLTIT
jgi:hypothetical protein